MLSPDDEKTLVPARIMKRVCEKCGSPPMTLGTWFLGGGKFGLVGIRVRGFFNRKYFIETHCSNAMCGHFWKTIEYEITLKEAREMVVKHEEMTTPKRILLTLEEQE